MRKPPAVGCNSQKEPNILSLLHKKKNLN